jgi:hypothetical protein
LGRPVHFRSCWLVGTTHYQRFEAFHRQIGLFPSLSSSSREIAHRALCVAADDVVECGREERMRCLGLAGGVEGRPVVGGVGRVGVGSSIGSPCAFSCLLAAVLCTLYGCHVRGSTSRQQLNIAVLTRVSETPVGTVRPLHLPEAVQ